MHYNYNFSQHIILTTFTKIHALNLYKQISRYEVQSVIIKLTETKFNLHNKALHRLNTARLKRENPQARKVRIQFLSYF